MYFGAAERRYFVAFPGDGEKGKREKDRERKKEINDNREKKQIEERERKTER